MQGALNAYDYNGVEQLRRELGASVVIDSTIDTAALTGKFIIASVSAELTITSDMRRARPIIAKVEAETDIDLTLNRLTVSSRGATIRRPYQGRSMRRVQSTREPTR